MSSDSKYEPLLGERSSPDFDHPESVRGNHLQQRRSYNVRLHWLAHTLSTVTILGLLLTTNRMYTFQGCLTHFNAYCLFISLLWPLLLFPL